MSRAKQPELELGLDPLPAAPPDLIIAASPRKQLSPAQTEFNKRMKALERARAAHERERARLDKELKVCREEFVPLEERISRAEFELIFEAAGVRDTIKLTARRKKFLGDLISAKAGDLLSNQTGLSDEEIVRLEDLIAELGPSVLVQREEEMEREAFGDMTDFLEKMAGDMGVDLDLGGLDLDADPAEMERELQKRLEAAEKSLEDAEQSKPKRKRKPTKAALERERRQQEVEEAKTRDFKSLYKQLAKVLHPDLEPDPVLKAHREDWMKRLTTARAEGDLREMLAIEMEWLGEESGNLAKAGDEKLRVYAMVLKEQLKELKERTRQLAFEPEYQALQRFAGPFGERQQPARVKSALGDEAERLEEMVEILRSGGKETLVVVNRWADAHARACKR